MQDAEEKLFLHLTVQETNHYGNVLVSNKYLYLVSLLTLANVLFIFSVSMYFA